MNIFTILEAFNYRAQIKWNEKQNIEIGNFSIDDEQFRIRIEHYTVNLKLSSGKILNSAVQVAFSRIESNAEIVDKVDSKTPNKVFGAVRNGILDKVDPKIDVIIFSAKKISGDSIEVFMKRSKLYESLARSVWKQTPFAYIDKKYSNFNGDHFILVNKTKNLTNDDINEILSIIERS